MMTAEEKHEYQIRWLAERLQSFGQRPYIGDCLQCGPFDDTRDCADCWVEASARVAEAAAATGSADGQQGLPGRAFQSTGYSISFTRLKPEQWIKPMREAFAIARRGWLCWTWADMILQDWQFDERAVSLVGRILQKLGSASSGTHTFWPCEDRDVFWSGVKELGVRVLCVLGETAALRVGLSEDETRPLHWEIRNGVVVVTLWGFDRLAEEPSRIEDCVTYLKATFRQLRLTI